MSPRDDDERPAMSLCDEVHVALLLGEPLDDTAATHAQSCTVCAGADAAARALSARLTAEPEETVPAGFSDRVLRAAAPLLERNRRRATARQLVRTLVAAFLPLPVIVLVDVYLLRGAYQLLSDVLPTSLSLYLVLNAAAMLGALLSLTYGAVPILAERQLRARRRELHV
ncbi:MAG TPA: hypothetical protein VEI94_06270 [Candidatus Bathyarchaeia archaeon]|nr:hypothetical protein [Candidatus Bathyarchaeia archaeon]